jgi:hypothetical protein
VSDPALAFGTFLIITMGTRGRREDNLVRDSPHHAEMRIDAFAADAAGALGQVHGARMRA